MSETFAQGLMVSAIGMGLVFAALAGLWALIAVLARLRMPAGLRGAEEDLTVLTELQTDEAALPPAIDEMAAISAVLALLRAEQEVEAGLRRRQPPVLTRWAAVGYGRQLNSWQPPRGRDQD